MTNDNLLHFVYIHLSLLSDKNWIIMWHYHKLDLMVQNKTVTTFVSIAYCSLHLYFIICIIHRA